MWTFQHCSGQKVTIKINQMQSWKHIKYISQKKKKNLLDVWTWHVRQATNLGKSHQKNKNKKNLHKAGFSQVKSHWYHKKNFQRAQQAGLNQTLGPKILTGMDKDPWGQVCWPHQVYNWKENDKLLAAKWVSPLPSFHDISIHMIFSNWRKVALSLPR